MTGGGRENQSIWEERYARGEAVNRYPYELVVGFVMRNFGKSDRGVVRILDYGCGGGGHCAFLAREGFDYYGIDYSPSGVRHTRETVRAAIGQPPCFSRVICGDFRALPFAADFFDAVIDRQSLGQNSAQAIPGLISEIFRVLRPGGKYFGINFSDRHPALRHGCHWGQGDYGNFTAGVFNGIGSRHFFNLDEVQTAFQMFVIEDIRVLSSFSVQDKNNGSEEFLITASKPPEC